MATSTSINLLVCATAGLAFYITLAGVLAKLIAALVVVIAAFGSVAGDLAAAQLYPMRGANALLRLTAEQQAMLTLFT